MANEYVDLYEDLLIKEPDKQTKDGITIFGALHPNSKAPKAVIRNCIIDFRNVPEEEQDEAISGVCGAVVEVENTIIIGAKKAMLCGNGDYPNQDKELGRWNLFNVAFIDCGRRCPEAQDGVHVYMNQCLIENWGVTFDVRSFGAWAHRGATIEANKCVFIQKEHPSIKNFLVDLGNHIGQAFNDRPSKLVDYITPGFLRAATASKDGNITLKECFANSFFLRLDGFRKNHQANLYEGFNVLKSMSKSFKAQPWMYKYLEENCPNSLLTRATVIDSFLSL